MVKDRPASKSKQRKAKRAVRARAPRTTGRRAEARDDSEIVPARKEQDDRWRGATRRTEERAQEQGDEIVEREGSNTEGGGGGGMLGKRRRSSRRRASQPREQHSRSQSPQAGTHSRGRGRREPMRGQRRRLRRLRTQSMSSDDARASSEKERKGDLQQALTEGLIKRVDDYVREELRNPDVLKRVNCTARVVGHAGNEAFLKQKVSQYVSQYIRALLKYRKDCADPYGEGVDDTSRIPMINIPSGSRKAPLPGKELFDKVCQCGLKVKLPDGLKASRRNDLLRAFRCFDSMKDAQNYLPYLKDNNYLAELPGFSSPKKKGAERADQSVDISSFFLMEALRCDINRYEAEAGGFKFLRLDRFPGVNAYSAMTSFWKEYLMLSLARRVKEGLREAVRYLDYLRRRDLPSSWLQVVESFYMEDWDLTRVSVTCLSSQRSMYESSRDPSGSFRRNIQREDICALGIRRTEGYSLEEKRVLGYIWGVGVHREELGLERKKWILVIPGRLMSGGGDVKMQAAPIYQATSEIRRAAVISFLSSLDSSLCASIFSPQSAPPIRFSAYYKHLEGDDAAKLLYNHYQSQLTDAQFQVLDLIMKALSADQKDGGNNVIAVQGPPGTGKSTVIGCSIALLLAKAMSDKHKGGKIIFCAPSNAAVDVVARRLKDGVDMVIVEGKPPGRMKVEKRSPNVVRLGPGCTDKRLKDIDIRSKIRAMADARGLNADGLKETEWASFEEKLVSEATVWCSTLINICQGKYHRAANDILAVIVDEAGQAIELDCLMPLLCQDKAPLCILVGDTKQLPPYEDIPEGRKVAEKSLLGRIVGYMQHTSNNCLRLDTQFRMHHAIARFPSNFFYKDSLKNDPSIYDARVFDRPYHYDYYGRFGPLTFFDTKYMAENEEYYPLGGSASNMCEATIIRELVTCLVRLHSAALSDEIVLLSPYSSQLELLSEMCRESPEMSQASITRSTVDSLQGGERGIVIFSTVRSNPRNEVGFLNDLRRMNVGMTRARFSLIIVGNSETLKSDKEGAWREFLKDIRDERLAYTHYICPRGDRISLEYVARKYFPESRISSGIAWRKSRFSIDDSNFP